MTAFTYDARGNRVSATTREGASFWSHLVEQTKFTYDGRDDLVATTDTGSIGCNDHDNTKTVFVRDGMGRALTVVEDGQATTRLYDGLEVVAEGDTQLVRDPSGAVQTEVTTTRSGHHWWDRAVTTEQDVLGDVLGSPVGVAVDGVISKDVQVFGDFGDVIDAAAWDTVTGFTGQVSTGGLVEFATRTYDAATRVWLQDDSYRGTTTRSASLNRYAYVEGAPESFVDVLGFYRARAAVRAQALAAAQAAYDAALKAYTQLVSNTHMQARLFAREMGQIQAEAAQRAASAQWVVEQAARKVEIARRTAMVNASFEADAKANDKGYWGGFVDTLSIAGWGLANVGIGILNTPSEAYNSFGCFYDVTCDKYQTRWGEVTVPNNAALGTIDPVGPSEYRSYQSEVGTDIGGLLLVVTTAKAGEKWGPSAVASEARVAKLQAELSAQSRGVSPRLAEQAQISHGHLSPTPKGPLDEGGYFKSVDEAKTVLAAYQSGDAEILGLSANGDMVVVRVPQVTGYNHNPGAGYPNQPTDTFFIKGTTKVSVVPTTPGGPSDMSLAFVDLSTLAVMAGESGLA